MQRGRHAYSTPYKIGMLMIWQLYIRCVLVQVEAAHSLGQHARSSLRRNKVCWLASQYSECAWHESHDL